MADTPLLGAFRVPATSMAPNQRSSGRLHRDARKRDPWQYPGDEGSPRRDRGPADRVRPRQRWPVPAQLTAARPRHPIVPASQSHRSDMRHACIALGLRKEAGGLRSCRRSSRPSSPSPQSSIVACPPLWSDIEGRFADRLPPGACQSRTNVSRSSRSSSASLDTCPDCHHAMAGVDRQPIPRPHRLIRHNAEGFMGSAQENADSAGHG